MQKANAAIREAAQAVDVKLWEIASQMNLNDGNFSRKLRKELSSEEKSRILKIIEDIVKEREQSA